MLLSPSTYSYKFFLPLENTEDISNSIWYSNGWFVYSVAVYTVGEISVSSVRDEILDFNVECSVANGGCVGVDVKNVFVKSEVYERVNKVCRIWIYVGFGTGGIL